MKGKKRTKKEGGKASVVGADDTSGVAVDAAVSIFGLCVSMQLTVGASSTREV